MPKAWGQQLPQRPFFFSQYKPMISSTFLFQTDIFTRRCNLKSKSQFTLTLERTSQQYAGGLCWLLQLPVSLVHGQHKQWQSKTSLWPGLCKRGKLQWYHRDGDFMEISLSVQLLGWIKSYLEPSAM